MNTYSPRNRKQALKARRKLQRNIMTAALAAVDKDDRRDSADDGLAVAAARQPL
ncbi:hypothetical protein ACD589_24765 [Rhizobium sp. 814_E9_N1_1]|uniref:hypothetical protein n=1 Tax=unclassified Rhizobium TaxID=2613769 RepID=UPI003F1FD509